MSCPEVVSVAAYLLGALDECETFSMRSHLRVCDECRDEVVDIAPLLVQLHRLVPRRWVRPHFAGAHRRGFRRLFGRPGETDAAFEVSDGALR